MLRAAVVAQAREGALGLGLRRVVDLRDGGVQRDEGLEVPARSGLRLLLSCGYGCCVMVLMEDRLAERPAGLRCGAGCECVGLRLGVLCGEGHVGREGHGDLPAVLILLIILGSGVQQVERVLDAR